ncbi:MAG: nitroreductase family deazaflavin-dependent oxidoreductase [Promethearchaeota archaeon]
MSNIKERDENKLPRPGSPMYNFHFAREDEKIKTLKRWKELNKYFTIPLYKIGLLPLLGFGKVFLLLTTKGRISGKKRTTPVEYRKKDGVIVVASARGERSHWFQNILANPEDVWIKKGFKKMPVRFEIIRDKNEILEFIKWYVRNYPRAAKMLFGWDPKKDTIEKVDFSDLVDVLKLIKVFPKA